MARTDGKAENQHYVPEMLLRNFAVPGRGKGQRVHVFDKGDGRSFPTSTKNIANERNFYEATGSKGRRLSLEQGLSILENDSKEPIQKLLDQRRLDALTDADRAQVCMFLAVQYVRTKTFREVQLDINAQLRARLAERGYAPDTFIALKGINATEEQVKLNQMAFIRDRGKHLALLMAVKHWVLVETDPDHPFWISDNPIVLHNDEPERGPLSNIGLAARGIQIYLPLSPTLLLGLWCPSWKSKVLGAVETNEMGCAEALEGWRRSALYAPGVDDVIFTHVFGAQRRSHREAADAIRSGTPYKCTPNNLVLFNWLQLRWAERQVYSSRDSFDLAREILRKDPGYRNPPRMTLS